VQNSICHSGTNAIHGLWDVTAEETGVSVSRVNSPS